MPQPYNHAAPAFDIAVANTRLGASITSLVESVVVETAENIAGMAELVVKDPKMELLDSKVFAAGNEMDVWFGYGPSLKHAGRYIITEPSYSFPEDGIPTFGVKAYTKDWRMMGNGPEHESKKPPGAKREKKKGLHGRAFSNVTYADAIEAIASSYSFALDIDKTPGGVTSMVQKSGMTDYAFVRAIANITGFIFWVDGDPSGRWTLHFRDPERIYDNASPFVVQSKRYTFTYGSADHAILSADPAYVLSDARTRIRATYRDPTTGKTIKADVEEEQTSPDVLFEGNASEKIAKPLPSAGAVRIYLDDFQVEQVADKRFQTQAQLEMWLRAWFQKRRSSMIDMKGQLIGIEDLKAFQIHALAGLGRTYSGDYFFSKVRHGFTAGDGYRTEFNARKVLL